MFMSMFFSTPLIFLVLLSSALGLSSGSVFMLWALMELNMLSFLGLLALTFFKQNKGEIFVYMFVQGTSSLVFLGFALLAPWLGSFSVLVIYLATLVKLGAAPAHVWLLKILTGLPLGASFLLLSVQKFLPLLVLSLLFFPGFSFAVLSAMVGAIGGVLSSNLLHILGYSSLANLGWMMAVSSNLPLLTLFVFLYSVNLLIFVNALEKKGGAETISTGLVFKTGGSGLNFLFSLLSMSGLPPFLGFLGKLISVGEILGQFYFLSVMVITIVSGLMLIPYLRLLFENFGRFSFSSTFMKSAAAQPSWLVVIVPVLYFV